MLLFLIVSTCIIYVKASDYGGYYWRDFSHQIPKDALSAGKDANGHDIYIGQTYVHGNGLFVGAIYKGQREIRLASYGYKKIYGLTKILCTKEPDKFSWLKTSSKSFHVDVTGKFPVIGGYDHRDLNKGMLHIGRLDFQGDMRIGSVEGFLENAVMTFLKGHNEQRANGYEVLIFDRM